MSGLPEQELLELERALREGAPPAALGAAVPALVGEVRRLQLALAEVQTRAGLAAELLEEYRKRARAVAGGGTR